MTSPAIRVLLVDPDEGYSAQVGAWLEASSRAHFQIERGATFQAGLGMLARQHPQVCLISNRLNEADGLRWVEEAVARGCPAPMLLLVEEDSPRLRARAAGSGVAEVLAKRDVQPATLEQTVLHSLERARATAALRAGEQALQQSEERFRRLFEDLPLGVAIVGLDYRLQQANRALCRLLDYRQEELIGSSMRQLSHPDDDTGEPLLQRVFAGDIPSFQQERRLMSKRGDEIWTYITAIAVRDARERILCGLAMIEDVTARKRLEQELWQSQKMETLGTLAGGIAHDFNNLLAVITGRSELLRHGLGTDSPQAQHVEAIQRSAARATSLVRQLLAFSRRQVLATQILNLNTVADGSREMLQRLLGEHIPLTIALDPELGSVKADPAQIEQVLMNLCVNARDAMPEGGRLIIETLNRDLPQPRRAVPAGRYVAVSVADTGAGMDTSLQEHIFEPFFTTKGKHVNSGLGLAAVYGIMQQSGGRIDVESALGAGTTFTLYFPRLDRSPDEVPAPTSAWRAPAGQS